MAADSSAADAEPAAASAVPLGVWPVDGGAPAGFCPAATAVPPAGLPGCAWPAAGAAVAGAACGAGFGTREARTIENSIVAWQDASTVTVFVTSAKAVSSAARSYSLGPGMSIE